jgi:nitrilase
MGKIKVAAIQYGSQAFDLKGSLDKVESLTEEAAKDGAQFVVFPEAFVSGYPRHLGFQIGSRSEDDRKWYTRYVKVCLIH